MLWAIWHVPLLGTSDDLSHGLSGAELTLVLAATIVNIVGLTFIYTFLYRHTRSTLLAMLLHGSFERGNGTLVLRDEIEGAAYAAMQYCITVTTLVIVAVLLVATRGPLGPRTDDTATPTSTTNVGVRSCRSSTMTIDTNVPCPADGAAAHHAAATPRRRSGRLRAWSSPLWADRRIGVSMAVPRPASGD